jgi:hypothetical protein
VNYSSLPPQLVVFKALRARHYVLAAVCTMALLANVLAIAFAGLFHHGIMEIRRPTIFQPPLGAMFISIDGGIGPASDMYMGSNITSGAYRGGNGKDQFYVAESNYTNGTPLPPWTDNKFFYIPFMAGLSDEPTGKDRYEAEAIALGAELDCSVLELGSTFHVDLAKGVNITVTFGETKAECTTPPYIVVTSSGPSTDSAEGPVCQRGDIALERAYTLEAKNANVSLAEKQICWETVVFGWLRDPEGTCTNQTRKIVPDANNSFFVQCRPRLVIGHERIEVDAEGRLSKEVTTLPRTLESNETKSMFNDTPSGLIGQSNRYIFQSTRPAWHNDSLATEYINYFASRMANNSRLLDPKQSLPTLADVQVPLSKAYSNLFAIWLGLNKEQLLVPRANGSANSSSGWIVVREERLFLSTALFAIAEGILAMYTVIAIVVYLRRPGAYLPRLPTSIASVIGLFAASGAVRDLRGTSRFESQERANHLEKLDARYGYGNYVGVDGMVHVGIEKTPFVRLRTETQRRRT